MLILLTGGARSGKSSTASALAGRRGDHVVLIATGQASDDEMVERIKRHRAERPDNWRVAEEPVHVAGALKASAEEETVIVDCLAFWVTNQLDSADSEILDRADQLALALTARAGLTIVVTNEVGNGVVPDHPLGRRFRDLLGMVNQRVAAVADQSYLCVAGQVLELTSSEQINV